MQVKNYCKKNQIPAQDVVELLASQYGGTWLLTSQLNAQIIDFLNQTFGNSSESKQLPASKEQLQLPESKQLPEQSSQLSESKKSEQLTNRNIQGSELTINDVKDLQLNTQISEVQEQAIHNAVEHFQVYQDTYDEITRALILKDVHQRTETRNKKRVEFEQKQNYRKSELAKKQQNSIDTKTEMLQVIKSDNYKNDYLTNILGGL